MAKKAKQKNAQDTTLRNNRARAREIEELRTKLRETNDRVVKTRQTLGTLISWIAQSAASPISQTDAAKLLQELVDQ